MLQCGWDWTSRGSLWIQKLYDIASGLNDADRYQYMKYCVSINAATESLFWLLMEELKSAPQIFLACHSQGNLIASNAISAASWVLGRLLHEINVFALASPATGWPGGARVKPYTNVQDPVTWLSLGHSQFGTDALSWVTGKKPWKATLEVPDVGIPGRPWTWFAAHSILEYIYQKDFIIDLRWAMRLAKGAPAREPRSTAESFGQKARGAFLSHKPFGSP